MGLTVTEVDMDKDYSSTISNFYSDRLDLIHDEISPTDLLWAGGYIVCTMSSLVVNDGVVQDPPYLWKTESTSVIKALDDAFVERKDKLLNHKSYKPYAFHDYVNNEFYEPIYNKVLTPDCVTTYFGVIFDGTSIRTYNYDGLKNVFTNKPYENPNVLTRTALTMLPELMYRRYADPSKGYPMLFSTRKDWENILDKIIAAFKIALYDLRLNTSTSFIELNDIEKEGAELYGKYLGEL